MAIANRDIMPLGAAVFKGFKYAFGLTSVFASSIGAVLLFMGIAKVPAQVHTVFWASLACWVGSYALCGWINSGGEPNRDRFKQRKQKKKRRRKGVRAHRARHPLVAAAMFWEFRVLQTIIAAVLCPVTAMIPAWVIIYSVFKGKPGRFVVIAKSHPGAS